ncbi:Protein CBG20062 [Caenorhabditis briggsae]|uniref:Protein CBG20062 n=1 Tax=Caenorhabditis briggsae TaxID=6238 RepID=A8XX06_CAEBR|nr:Protein CBG20062 [Caenorhabditis briggsae]CAP37175.1 Protein CBG20062 [Caenorhabditis briggsae]
MKLISILFLISLLISVALAQPQIRMKVISNEKSSSFLNSEFKRLRPLWRRIVNMAHGNTRTTQPSRNLSFGAFSSDGSSSFRSGDAGGFRG